MPIKTAGEVAWPNSTHRQGPTVLTSTFAPPSMFLANGQSKKPGTRFAFNRSTISLDRAVSPKQSKSHEQVSTASADSLEIVHRRTHFFGVKLKSAGRCLCKHEAQRTIRWSINETRHEHEEAKPIQALAHDSASCTAPHLLMAD